MGLGVGGLPDPRFALGITPHTIVQSGLVSLPCFMHGWPPVRGGHIRVGSAI